MTVMEHTKEHCEIDLTKHGLTGVTEVLRNLATSSYSLKKRCLVWKATKRRGNGTRLSVAVDTGIFTGRSPKDKYIVKDDTTRDTMWWSDQGKNDNKPITTEVWNELKSL